MINAKRTRMEKIKTKVSKMHKSRRSLTLKDQTIILYSKEFSLIRIRGRKCIRQFTDDRNSTKYALKVANATNVIFENVLACLVTVRVADARLRSRRLAGSWTLRSYFRKIKPCNGGTLIKIDTDQCKVSNGKRQCRARCSGASTRDPKAKFKFVKVRGKKCIQFTDDRDGIKYALKVIKGTSVAFEEHKCHGARDANFLFEEENVTGRLYQYKHTTIFNTTMCLGVAGDCDENLTLESANIRHSRCLFRIRRK